MATNKILPFASLDTTTNLLTDDEYSADAQRIVGNQPGIARSKLVNKAMRQSSLISSSLSQYLAENQNSNIDDSMSVTGVAEAIDRAIPKVYSVRKAGAKGNGVDSDQSAIEEAVSFCFANEVTLDWPPGTYVSTANIPNFDNVIHTGRGVIKRGSTTYAVQPNGKSTQTNNIYVSPSGNNANDGRTPDLPKATLQAAFDALGSADGSKLYGTWAVNLAAGTYNDYATLDGVLSRNRLRIVGPDVAGGTPTAIIDGTGLTAQSLNGILLSNGIYGYVRDIKFYNWNGGSGVGSGDASTGLNVSLNCNVWADNCDFDLCGTGLAATRSRIYQGRGRVTGCDIGSTAFSNTTCSYGYGGATVYTSIPIAINIRDASSGVVDAGTFTSCSTGIKVTHQSITRISNCTFTDSTAADAYIYTGSSVFFGLGNTHTPNNKLRGQFALDLDSASQFFYNGDTDRFNFGTLATPGYKFHFRNGAATSSFVASTVSLAVESNSPQIGLNGGATGTFGLQCAIPGVSGAASLLYTASDSSWRVRVDNTDSYRIASTNFRPVSDNTASLGLSGYRWSAVFAGTGTINTSDAREKQQVRELSEQERAVAVRLKSLIRSFKFNDAVETKGDGARIHVGVLAQDVKAAFEAEGLVAENYALLCYDEWEETPEERDEEGNVVQEYRPAGSRYGVRYEELLAFIIGAM